MKHHLSRITSLFLAFALVFSLVPSNIVNAAPSSIYFTPANGTYTTGASFSTQVRATSDPIYFQYGSTSGTINFPANRLRVTSISNSGSSYPNISTAINNVNGTISFNGTAYPSPTTIYLFTINFQTLSAGSAPVTFSADTTVNHNSFNNITSTNRSSALFTINNPAPATCPAGQVGTPPNCTTPPATCPAGQTGTPPNCKTPPAATCPAGQTGTPPNCKTPTPTQPSQGDTATVPQNITPQVPATQVNDGDLSITDVSAKADRAQNAVSWRTSLPNVNSNILLGTSKEDLSIKPEVTKISDGNYASVINGLKLGTRYYYTITGTAIDNPEKKATYSGAFTTRGYPVKLVVTSNGQAVSNAVLTLEQQNYKTDKNGAVLLELGDGTHGVTISLADKSSKSVSFTVAKKTIPANGGDPDQQIFSFDIPTTQQAQTVAARQDWMWLIISGAIGAALLIGGGLFLVYKRRKNEQGTATSTPDSDLWIPPVITAANSITPSLPVSPEQKQQSMVTAIEQQYIPETDQPQQYAMTPGITEQPLPTYDTPLPMPPNPAPSIEQQPEMMPQQEIEIAPVAAPLIEAVPEATNTLPSEEQPTQTEQDTNSDDDLIGATYNEETGELDIIHPDEARHHSPMAVNDENIAIQNPSIEYPEQPETTLQDITPVETEAPPTDPDSEQPSQGGRVEQA